MRLNNFKEHQRQSIKNEKIQLQEAKENLNRFRAGSYDLAIVEELGLKQKAARRDRRSVENAKELLRLYKYKAEDWSVLPEFKKYQYISPQNSNRRLSGSSSSSSFSSSSSSNSLLPCSNAKSNTTTTTKLDTSGNNNNENINTKERGGAYHKNLNESKIRAPSFTWKDLKDRDEDEDSSSDSDRLYEYCDDLKPSMTTDTETTDWTEYSSSEMIEQQETAFDEDDGYDFDPSVTINDRIETVGEGNNSSSSSSSMVQEGIQSKGVQKVGDSISDIHIRGQSERERRYSNQHFTANLRELQSSADFEETDDKEGSNRSISTNNHINNNNNVDDGSPDGNNAKDPYYDDNNIGSKQKKEEELDLCGKRVIEKECLTCIVM